MNILLKKTLTVPGVPWFAEIDGKDIVVRKVIVTAFGGGFDKGDDGKTASGVMNDGSDPNLLGCALPILSSDKHTKNSPLAFPTQIPWKTKVRFWQGSNEDAGIETILIDNGPDVLDYPTHAGDLTVAAAMFFAPRIAREDIANDFETILSYRIIGAATAQNFTLSVPRVAQAMAKRRGALPPK